MRYNLIWESEVPELTDDQQLHLSREISWLEQSIDDISQLVYHVVVFNKNYDGPSVTIYGKNDHPNDLFLEYTEETEWLTMDKMSEDIVD